VLKIHLLPFLPCVGDVKRLKIHLLPFLSLSSFVPI
jgi:hypothetical protein